MFIELTAKDGDLMTFHINHIKGFYGLHWGSKILMGDDEGNHYNVKESYQEVSMKIEESKIAEAMFSKFSSIELIAMAEVIEKSKEKLCSSN